MRVLDSPIIVSFSFHALGKSHIKCGLSSGTELCLGNTLFPWQTNQGEQTKGSEI